MRVWLVDEFGHGGIGRYAVDVSNLIGDAARTVVATSALGPVGGLRGEAVEWFPRVRESALGKGLGGVVGLARAARAVRRGDVAWVPLGIRPAFELALVGLLRGRGAQVVVTVHNRGKHGHGDSAMVLRAARLAHHTVVHTDALEAWAAEHRLAMVRLPFPPPDVRARCDGHATAAPLDRHVLDIPAGSVVLSMIGYLHAYKGVDLLVEAASRARSTAPDLAVHVLLAGRQPSGPGSGDVAAALERAAADRSVTVRVGWLEEHELAALLDLTDVVALPYREIDNSGSGSLARSRGLPALASDLPALREIFGDAAVYVPPGDVDGLVGALVELPERLPALRERAAVTPAVDLVAAYRGFVDGLTARVRDRGR